MPRKRRVFDGTFKAKVALDALRGLKPVSELAAQHKVHPTQIMLWKKQLLEGAAEVFASPMGLQSLAPRPSTTRRAVGHKVYPYLLRGIEVVRPNQVWACDITYVPLRQG